MDEGYALDAFAVNATQRLLICAVHGKATHLLVYKFGETKPIQALEGAFRGRLSMPLLPPAFQCQCAGGCAGGAELQYAHVAIARNGKRMVTVSAAPNPRLVYWDLARFSKLVRFAVADFCWWLLLCVGRFRRCPF